MKIRIRGKYDMSGKRIYSIIGKVIVFILLSAFILLNQGDISLADETATNAAETDATTTNETTGGNEPAAGEPVKARYEAAFFQRGWSREFKDNSLATAPVGSYVTAFRASLVNQPEGMTGTISYQVNLSGTGWLDWTEDMAEAGRGDGEMPLEAVRIYLTGQLAEQYNVYYKVLQNGAWTEWAMNQAAAGIEGAGLRIDGIRIAIMPIDGGEPAEIPTGGIDPSRPMVALTFDDGPHAAVTPRILNCLEAYGGHATFFMVGNRVPANASVVSRMVSLGCEVGNHTYDHKYLTNLGDGGIRTSVGQTNQIIANACGVPPILMRPTGGYYNAGNINTLGSMGMSAVMWSLDTRDWKTRNAQTTIDTVLNHVKDGDIVLMHDLYEPTAVAAERIIPELTARGYQLVTVSELAAYRGGLNPGQVYSAFRR